MMVSSKKDSSSSMDSPSSSMDSPAPALLLIKMKFSDSNIIQFGYEENDVECFLADVEIRSGQVQSTTLKPWMTNADAKILLNLLNDQEHLLNTKTIEDLNMPLASVREALETHDQGDLMAFAGEELTNSSLDGGESLASLPELPKRYHNEFTELQFLGKGGCGSVFLCQHKFDKREYAMKKIRVEDRDVPKFVLTEVAALSGMQSSRIIRYHQAWVERGFVPHKPDKTLNLSDSSENSKKLPDEEACCVYIQMEYCKNRTLKEFLGSDHHKNLLKSDEHQPTNTNLIWRLIRQILQGLKYIHRLDVIHRDIKPDNIFLDANDDAKIGDFGLAKIIKNGNDGAAGSSSEGNSGEKLKDSSGVAGTGVYISPEVKNKSKSVDQKADIYSFGIMFFELWNHYGSETERACNLMKLGKREIPNDWTESFPLQSALLAQMLNPDPLERPSAKDLLKVIPSIPARSPTGSPV